MVTRRLIFFTDGAKCKKDAIEKHFRFRECTIILYWLHMRKKQKEMISMAVWGRKRKERLPRGCCADLRVGNAKEAKGLSEKN